VKKIGIIVPSFMEGQLLDIKGIKNIELSISGMGKVRAALGVVELIKKGCKSILLTGYAGGLYGLKMGDVVTPYAVIEGDYHAEPFEKYPNSLVLNNIFLKHAKHCSLITQDMFLKKNIYKEQLFDGVDLATDMEAYAVAYFCRQLGIKLYVVKIISDVVGAKSEKNFLDSCTKLSEQLSFVIKKSIEQIRKEEK